MSRENSTCCHQVSPWKSIMKKKVKIYPHVAGNTLKSHEKILQKLCKRGAKTVSQEESDMIIIFCPIVSRFQSDIQAALSSISGSQEVILVAMHHTHDKNYPLPDQRHFSIPAVTLVECLFFEKEGLLKCHQNKKAVGQLYEKLKSIKKSLKRKE